MPTFKLPTEDALAKILEMVAPNSSAASTAADAGSLVYAAEFEDDEGQLVSLCLADIAAAAGLGCALSMIPPGGAEDMRSEGLSEIAEANLYEVMNMLSTVYMTESTPHLKLTKLVKIEDCPAANEDRFEVGDWSLDLGAYGTGTLSFRTV
ncbi:MAG: hypothetical protein AAF648_06665 [Pseudomonadota bacterium]